MARPYILHSELWLPHPADEVFAFFADAQNLQRITPPWLHFRIVTAGPIEIQAGTRIDYRLRVRGLPARWQSEITEWEPPRRFVDQQRRGPYRLWVHEHTFEPHEGGTRVRDEVRYDVWCGPLVNRLFLRGDLERVFAYRQQQLQAIFSQGPTPPQE